MMITIALFATILGAVGGTCANLVFVWKRRQKAWIPPMLMTTWIGLWFLAAAGGWAAAIANRLLRGVA
jgi:hypothetical protein